MVFLELRLRIVSLIGFDAERFNQRLLWSEGKTRPAGLVMCKGWLATVEITKLLSNISYNLFTNLSPVPDNFFAPSGKVET